MTSTDATDTLAGFIADTTTGDLPGDVVDAARRCLRDSLACAIAGASVAPGRIVHEFTADMGGRPDATLLPSGPRVPSVSAVLANSYLANVLDMDDTLNGHPGACVVPAALAVGEQVGASGAEVLRAIVLGYEVAVRIGQAILPTPARWREVYASGTYLGMGAAVAASSLLGLDAGRIRGALGLAAANAVVPSVRKLGLEEDGPLSWVKNNYGTAAAGGVQAALLAERGFRGNETVLDGAHGFWIMAGSDRCDFETLTGGLGSRWLISDVSFKPYPCCRYLHGAVTALERICARTGASWDEITNVRVEGYHHLRTFVRPAPASMVDAQFNLAYALSMVALRVTPGLRWFDKRWFGDAAVGEFSGRITFTPSDSFDGPTRYGSRVSATVRGGEVTEEVVYPLGHPRNPLDETALESKFHALVSPVLGVERARRLAESIASVADLGDIRLLTKDLHDSAHAVSR